METKTIEELVKNARAVGRARFVESNPQPFLVLDYLSSTSDLEAFSTTDGAQVSPFARIRPGPPSPRTKTTTVGKRIGANDFTNMITVGRATNNDVTLEVSSVSKFHAYFTKDDAGVWFLHDAGSSNGTWVNGERIAQSGKTKLDDGASIQLGPDARMRFYRSGALFDIVASPSATGGDAGSVK